LHLFLIIIDQSETKQSYSNVDWSNNCRYVNGGESETMAGLKTFLKY
jgi:hypothetical protein